MTRHIRLRLPVTNLLTLPFLPLTAQAEQGRAPPFEKWQLWECTQTDKPSRPNERLPFIVTGQAAIREISRRPNFQNDKVIISVSLINLDPWAGPHAKRFFIWVLLGNTCWNVIQS